MGYWLAFMLSPKYPPNVPFPWATYKHGLLVAPPPVLSLDSSCLSYCPDLGSFESSVFEGSFYESLCKKTGLDRQTVKLRFLVDVLAKRGRYPSPVEQVFRRDYPTVHRAIRETNRDDHGTLIRMLQAAESWLWLIRKNLQHSIVRKCRGSVIDFGTCVSACVE